MSWLYSLAAWLLVVSLLFGVVRIAIGPSEADRMVTAQLFGTTGVAILLLLAYSVQSRPIIDVALVLAVLAVIAIVAFVRRVRQPLRSELPTDE